MKNTKTKRALISSAISLLLCFAMLLGTTFAWFTDSVSSGVNTIKAGNLDIEVQYRTEGTAWTDLDGTRSLFSSNLWEPGHTEVVYLKVMNKGTLGLNYKVLVTPVTENGGVNVAGNSFKLSDYLVFGTTEPGAETTYTREAARAAVGATTGLADVNTLTKSNTMVGKDVAGYADQYLALVVYMPESVGNEANYKTGTTAPTIELGINVVATQLTAELDSYGPDYDGGAVTDSFYTVGSYYNYFPQVSVSAEVNNVNNAVGTGVTITARENPSDSNSPVLAEVTVPAGVQLKANTTELTVKVVPTDAAASSTEGTALAAEIANSNRETANFDIKVEGVENSDSNPDIPLKVFIGKGLANVKLYHNGALITSNYDAGTGYVTFTTKGFSDFTAAYDVAVAAIGAQTYGTLALAVAAAQNGDTVKLLKDSVVDTKIEVTKSLTLDLNGYKLTANTKASRMLWVTAPNVTLTINGTATGSGMVIGDTNAASNTEKVWGFVDLRAGSEGSKVVVNGGSYTGAVCANDNYNYGSMFMNRSSSEIVLNHVAVETDVCVLNNSTGGKVTVNDSKVNITGIDAYLTAAFYTGNAIAEFNNMDLTAKYGGCVQVGKTATLNNCNILVTDVRTGNGTHQNCAVAAQNNGTVTVNGGSYSAPYAVYVYNSGGTFNINDGNFKGSTNVLRADKGAINVYGGNFDGTYGVTGTGTISITGGTFSADPSAYVADGYTAKQDGDVWKVHFGDVLISNAKELVAFANAVNAGNSYAGETVALTADIDLQGVEWTPIGNTKIYAGEHTVGDTVFAGSFNGCGHTISNLTVTGDDGNIGFFGKVKFSRESKLENVVFDHATVIGNKAHCVGVLAGSVTADGVKWVSNDGNGGGFDTDNVTDIVVKNSTVVGSKYVGGVIGYAQTDIDNVEVVNTKVTSLYDATYQSGASYTDENDSGENAGAVVGDLYSVFSITRAKVTNCTVGGFDKVGGVAGSSRSAHRIANSTVTDLKIEMVAVGGSSKSHYGLITGRADSANGYASRYTGNTATGTATRDGADISVTEYAIP